MLYSVEHALSTSTRRGTALHLIEIEPAAAASRWLNWQCSTARSNQRNTGIRLHPTPATRPAKTRPPRVPGVGSMPAGVGPTPSTPRKWATRPLGALVPPPQPPPPIDRPPPPPTLQHLPSLRSRLPPRSLPRSLPRLGTRSSLRRWTPRCKPSGRHTRRRVPTWRDTRHSSAAPTTCHGKSRRTPSGSDVTKTSDPMPSSTACFPRQGVSPTVTIRASGMRICARQRRPPLRTLRMISTKCQHGARR